MPYIYIGRKTTHVGKTLWQLLGNLKDYGVGRLIIRGSQQRYEEPCFLRIARVFPQFHEPEDEPRKVAVWAENVFRGNRYPDLVQIMRVTRKHDFQLVPKEDEDRLYELAKVKRKTPNVVPNKRCVPPLLKELLLREAVAESKKIEEPELKLNLRKSKNNDAREDPTLPATEGLGTPPAEAACLYTNIDTYFQARQAGTTHPKFPYNRSGKLNG
nr:PREDICTED: 28S ribosomal protein S34, mitochondrial [Bemisia tabaci]